MKKRILRITFRRFAELLLIEMALSIFITILNIYGFLASQQRLLTGLFVGGNVYVGLNAFLMRNSFYFLRRDWAYYISNFLAYFIFAGINLLFYNFGGALYTWFFALTKVFSYTRYGISSYISAFICHGVMLILIPLSTIGIDWEKI